MPAKKKKKAATKRKTSTPKPSRGLIRLVPLESYDSRQCMESARQAASPRTDALVLVEGLEVRVAHDSDLDELHVRWEEAKADGAEITSVVPPYPVKTKSKKKKAATNARTRTAK